MCKLAEHNACTRHPVERVQETEASKKAMAEAERAEAAKHKKWQEAEKAGQAADEYAAKKLDKVEEVLHSKMEAMAKKAKVSFA